jgi:hypothetical protein
MNLTSGTRVSARGKRKGRREGREKVPWQKGTNLKGKRNNDSTPMARGPAGEAVPAREATACRDG